MFIQNLFLNCTILIKKDLEIGVKKMSQLLQNEQAFLEGNSALNFRRITTLSTQLTDSKKKKFEVSLELAKHVKTTKNWFDSDEGKDQLIEEGIEWTTELMFLKIFGWKKSYAYKLIKLATLKEENPSIISTWKRECTRLEGEGENVSRSVENLLKFAKESENASESGENPSVAIRPSVLLEVKMEGKKAKITGENESPIFKTDMTISEVEQLIVYATRLKDYIVSDMS